ncbi:MAG: gliding motility-associated C-terminal domain-containing protein, partial [Flavobacteriales bacterium]
NWAPSIYVSSATTSNPLAYPDSSMYINVSVTDDNSCTKTDSVFITVDKVTVNVTGDTVINCFDGSVNLNAQVNTTSNSSAIKYSWNTVNGNIVGSVTDSNIIVSEAGNYLITATDTIRGCADSTEETTTSANDRPTPSFNPQNITCKSDSAIIDASSSTFVNGKDSLSWSTTDGKIISGFNNDTVLVSSPGSYELWLSDTMGCNTSGITEVNMDTISPSVSLSHPEPLQLNCSNDPIEIQLLNPKNRIRYKWLSSFEFSKLNNSEGIIVSDTGKYSLMATDTTTGCKSSKHLNVDRNCELKSFNTFTPNGDNKNDKWVINGIEKAPNNEVIIYNRWGDLIQKFSSYDNKDIVWKGKDDNGNPLNDGTFFYIIHLKEKGKKRSGWVHILSK